YLRKTAAAAQFSVRWTGFIEAPVTGELALHTISNDGARLWVNEKLLMDEWVDQSETEHTGRLTVTAGQKLPLKLEYFYNGGQGAAKLWWSADGLTKAHVPAAALSLPDGSGGGLRGEYFYGNDFQTFWNSRIDTQVNFAWGTQCPFPASTSNAVTALQIALPD